ncbi:translocation/assembly module TamB domain-containing protein [Streptomyces cavernicola]|uniref:Membrane-associated oxidoreductase n=1 Tax=Streptomyces cavernicola TaxID=3043613 RepID=A0ABT6S9I3_9ACTN|nr:membrane-associated oxidoreductase [Streptomyces sp. B-S-A6]MDI3404791.1 membrane-associated oxidoreductase [Streptomyces sp. B-S-A6]
MEIMDLTGSERRVWEAFPSGARIDLTAEPEESRTLRAQVLRALLLGDHRSDGEVAALRVAGARITGTLQLRYAVAESAITLLACTFEEPPDLYGAELRQLNLSHCTLPALHAATVRVDGVLRITGCRIPGPVRLGGARIAGAFFLDRAELGPTEGQLAEPTLQLNQATVGHDVHGPGLVAHGEVRLQGAAVSGAVQLNDAFLDNPGGDALSAKTLAVGSDVHGMRLRALGRVNLRGLQVPGQLNFAFARFANPGGTALRVSSSVIGELWLREAPRIDGEVTLRRSQIDLLNIPPEAYPDTVRLDGLVYTTLDPHEPAERRLDLLERELEGYVPHAYEQLTTAYRRVGDDAAARTVQLAKQRRHRATLPAYARAWGHLQDVTVGYGFRPVRAAGWLASLLLLGTLAFVLDAPRALKPDESPPFNALAYTLDLLLPIVDLGQEKAYAPDGGAQWLAYGLIVTGWVLATTIAAGVTRTISRQ